jgi:hypothetical protein
MPALLIMSYSRGEERKRGEKKRDLTNDFLGMLVIVSCCILCGGHVFVVGR